MSERRSRREGTQTTPDDEGDARQKARERLSARQHAQQGGRRNDAEDRSSRQKRSAPTVGHVRPQTFDSVGGASDLSTPERIIGLLAAGLLGLIRLVLRGLRALGGLFARLMRKSKVAGVAVIVVVALVAGGLVDSALNAGKIYPGITIGSVDVSGMTEKQAANAVHAAYNERVQSREVIIFSTEEVASSVDVEQQLVQDQAQAEQISFEEAQKSKILWVETAEDLGASVPAEDYAREAFEVGREGIGMIDRISALVGGWNIEVGVSFDEEKIEALASDIDSSIGEPRQDYDIVIEQGQASVVEGHDGDMIGRDGLKAEISDVLLSDGEQNVGSFVAWVEYAPLRIGEAQAQRTCDAVNAAIEQGATFSSDGETLEVSRETLGDWIDTRIDETDSVFLLCPYVDQELATPSLVALVNGSDQGDSSNVVIDITVNGDEVTVTPQGEVTVPEITEAISALDASLFDSYRQLGQAEGASHDAISIATRVVSGDLSFEETYSYGIVTEISSYTTQYTNAESTQNRNHNIHLVADLLNNSVAEADGGTWSFNTVAGNCNEDAGFLPAGAISGDQYVDEAGGGICQVATTVFNAVYEAGYPVVARSNHTLYMASYPAGRDAAVSYPDLDFIWENDTDSDVLVRTSYTDTSVTVALYGVDPGYSVSTETGEWVEGEKHSTREEQDDTLAPGTSYVKTVGTDGMEITVFRTVKDADDTVVRVDSFYSIYAPITEVIVKGPEAEGDGASGAQEADGQQADASGGADSPSASSSGSSSSAASS